MVAQAPDRDLADSGDGEPVVENLLPEGRLKVQTQKDNLSLRATGYFEARCIEAKAFTNRYRREMVLLVFEAAAGRERGLRSTWFYQLPTSLKSSCKLTKRWEEASEKRADGDTDLDLSVFCKGTWWILVDRPGANRKGQRGDYYRVADFCRSLDCLKARSGSREVKGAGWDDKTPMTP